jgi:phosphatidylethanolamine-binding protein (PEBP) family uncharacterized protein
LPLERGQRGAAPWSADDHDDTGFAEAVIPVEFSQAALGVPHPAKGLPGFTMNAPAERAPFVLNMHDMEVVRNKTTDDQAHWVVWNSPATATGIPKGAPKGAAAGRQLPDQRDRQVCGPGAAASPMHHYMFELYALDPRSPSNRRPTPSRRART